MSVRGAEVRLSNKEWDILRLLVVNAGKVLTQRAIMQEVWGPKVDVQYLRIYVRQLRQKLDAIRACCPVTWAVTLRLAHLGGNMAAGAWP